MKKLPIFTLFALALSLSGFEIEDRKTFWVKTAPTQMSAAVSFSTNRAAQTSVKTILDNILKDVKTNNSICKGGEYYIYPTSEYDQNAKKTVRKGYEGNIRFECRFSDVAPYDEFLEFINKQVKDKNMDRVHIYPIAWELLQEESEAITDKLKMRALEYTTKRASELSRATKSACELKKISFDAAQTEQRYYAAPRMMTASLPSQTPIPEAKEVSVSAYTLFECKK